MELAQAGAGPVYDACLASPLLLSPKMARALLLKAGTEKRPPKGKPPGKKGGASPDDAAAVGAVAGVVSACLDRDRSAYVALADLFLVLAGPWEHADDGSQTRRGPERPRTSSSIASGAAVHGAVPA